MLVASAGTGGTITGIARKLKEKCPGCKVSDPGAADGRWGHAGTCPARRRRPRRVCVSALWPQLQLDAESPSSGHRAPRVASALELKVPRPDTPAYGLCPGQCVCLYRSGSGPRPMRPNALVGGQLSWVASEDCCRSCKLSGSGPACAAPGEVSGLGVKRGPGKGLVGTSRWGVHFSAHCPHRHQVSPWGSQGSPGAPCSSGAPLGGSPTPRAIPSECPGVNVYLGISPILGFPVCPEARE